MTEEELKEEPIEPKKRKRLQRKARTIHRSTFQHVKEKFQKFKDFMNGVNVRLLSREPKCPYEESSYLTYPSLIDLYRKKVDEAEEIEVVEAPPFQEKMIATNL